ncbi:MAG TPA: glycosyltransferase [Pirellulales bacterium]|jgi:hypothetical protein|nr:glycosyltransferase [Pirellulales bacterium]
MIRSRRKLVDLADRGPLRTMFIVTSMPVGGLETLLVNLMCRVDRSRIEPELCCLKDLGPLGTMLSREVNAFSNLTGNKYDVRVLGRLTKLLRERRIDAIVTAGTGGDRMFWGRLAAWFAGCPVILSAIHSTGLPNKVEPLNRMLAPITDGFIAVAETHATYLAEHEGCPERKVFVVPNGVDTRRFSPQEPDASLRSNLGLPLGAPIAAIVAALRPEKNHELFLESAALIRKVRRDARFLVIGDGPLREELEARASQLGIGDAVHFLGTRSDIPELLGLTDVLMLTSHMEANPVSVLEALACAKPVVATQVGSLGEVVQDGATGYLVRPGDAKALADRVITLFNDPARAQGLGRRGRSLVESKWSLEQMVVGYEDLITEIYMTKYRRNIKRDPRNISVPGREEHVAR